MSARNMWDHDLFEGVVLPLGGPGRRDGWFGFGRGTLGAG